MAEKFVKLNVEQTYPLRQKELRNGLGIEFCKLAGDELETSFHFGLQSMNDVLAIASFLLSKSVIEEQKIAEENKWHLGKELSDLFGNSNVYRLRAMAVDSNYSSKGFGKLLLNQSLQVLKAYGGQFLWCDARESAMGFYKKLGFEIYGDRYMVPDVGPHFKMWRKL